MAFMPRNPATLDTPLRTLFPTAVVVAALAGDADPELLLPGERAAVATAVALRVRQFTAGRLCARRALGELQGVEADALPAGADRVPLWPAGITGSISHTEGLAAAVIARSDAFIGVGIDVEPRGSVRPHLWEAICRPEEVDWLRGFDTQQALDAATLLFCAKEAFYKAQYAAVAEWVGFKDVRVQLSPLSDGSGRFVVEPQRSLKISQRLSGAIEGICRLHGEFAAAGLVLPA
jgi:4'-phosphopantetheinyl transferase EntD